MSTDRDAQEATARAAVIEIMNMIRQKYTEKRPVNGETGEKLAFSDLFCSMLENEVIDFAATTQDEEFRNEFMA